VCVCIGDIGDTGAGDKCIPGERSLCGPLPGRACRSASARLSPRTSIFPPVYTHKKKEKKRKNIHIPTCIHTHTHTRTHTSTRARTHTRTHIHTHSLSLCIRMTITTNIHVPNYMYVRTYGRMYVRMYVCTYVCTYARTYGCMFVRMYVRTYVCTYTWMSKHHMDGVSIIKYVIMYVRTHRQGEKSQFSCGF
jgi:hypothetical protein